MIPPVFERKLPRGLQGAVRARWFIAVLVLLACDHQEDYSWPACAMTSSVGPLAVDSAEIAAWSNPFSVTIHGTVHDTTIVSLDFADGAGAVTTSEGPKPSLLYDQYDFAGYRGYTAIVPDADRWHILYPYCVGESLHTVWHFDTTSHRFRELPASGTCIGNDVPSVARGISLPASTLRLPVLCGLEIEAVGIDPTAQGARTGETISLRRDQAGTTMRRDSTGALSESQFIPFAGVNCSSCGSPGWYEVHSILWSALSRSATYAVLYLFTGEGKTFPSRGGRLLLDSHFEMPRPSRLSVGIFEGTWTASP